MKPLTKILEGLLGSIDDDMDAAVKEESIFVYLKRPELIDWDEFYKTVNKWAQTAGKIGGLYRDKKLCGNQPVAYICDYIDKVFDDHFHLGLKTGDRFIILFLTEKSGARIYARAGNGKTRVKVIPTGSGLTIASEVSGGKMWANITNMPYYDIYYKVQTCHVNEYDIKPQDVKKISTL